MEIVNKTFSVKNIMKPAFVKPCADLVLTSGRVLDSLLVSECHYGHLQGDYMHHIQEHLLPHHRNIVTNWMLEVYEVFLSSVK